MNEEKQGMMEFLDKLFRDDGLVLMSYWDPNMNGGQGGEYRVFFWSNND